MARARQQGLARITSKRLRPASPRRAGKPALPHGSSAAVRAVLDSMEDALLLVDLRGQVQCANARFREWMGIDVNQTGGMMTEAQLNRRLAPHFRQPESFSAAKGKRQEEQGVWDQLEQLRPAHRLLERLVRPVFDGKGRAIGRLQVYREVTAGRAPGLRTQRMERMAALGQLVSGIAHELSNPLTSILGYAERLHVQNGFSAGAAENADVILREAQRAQRIVKDLLLFARDTRPERALLQLNELVERAQALRGRELLRKGITLHLDLDEELPLIPGNAHQLQQVLLNLLINAEHAIEARPATARSKSRGRGNIGIRTRHSKQGRVLLEVLDDGVGVARDIGARVFEPFFTTKPAGEGTGLGLSLASGIVREHGGEIAVTGAAAAGAAAGPAKVKWRTVFRVELPVENRLLRKDTARGQPAFASPFPPKHPASPQAAQILVVEDEPTIAQLIRDVLKQDGIDADLVSSGQAGLKQLLDKNSRGNPRRYDLVVCDFKMPGMDGASLYRKLLERDHPAAQRFLFITGDTLSRRARDFMERYKTPCLPKPFLADELRAAVRRCLSSAAGASLENGGGN